jgi:acetyl esterase/lipase
VALGARELSIAAHHMDTDYQVTIILLRRLSEDKKDYGVLARNLAAYTSSPVAVPNYRLTQPDNGVQHPTHAQDVLQLLTFLLSWSGPQGCQSPPYDPNRIFLMGHSCSAHMLSCILLDSSEPALVPSAALLRAVRGVVLSEGIYDIDTLLKSFPTYREWFIRETFGDLPTYDRYSATRMVLREGAKHISWIILHSKGDTLVDTLQSQAIYDHLQSLHDGGLQEGGQVVKNWDDLEDDHNAILQSGKYIQIVGDFICRVPNA